MSKKETDVLTQLKEIAHHTVPKGGQVLLYGSRARGEAHKNSDWDILVIIDKDRLSLDDYASITYPMSMVGWEMGETINPILYTSQEWKDSAHTPFHENVVHDAVQII